jgi:hypothetical protein
MSVTRSKSWKDIRKHYGDRESFSPIIRLLDWIQAQGLENEIFAHTSMFDLIISNQQQGRMGENALRIGLSGRGHLRFRYDRLFASTDFEEKIVPHEEAVETLRVFLAYKFGVYRPTDAMPRPPVAKNLP